MNTDNHFLSPILIIRIHPAQKAISYAINLIGRRFSQITTDDEIVKNTPSPLRGEGQGEGEESRNFTKLLIPLPHLGGGTFGALPIPPPLAGGGWGGGG